MRAALHFTVYFKEKKRGRRIISHEAWAQQRQAGWLGLGADAGRCSAVHSQKVAAFTRLRNCRTQDRIPAFFPWAPRLGGLKATDIQLFIILLIFIFGIQIIPSFIPYWSYISRDPSHVRRVRERKGKISETSADSNKFIQLAQGTARKRWQSGFLNIVFFFHQAAACKIIWGRFWSKRWICAPWVCGQIMPLSLLMLSKGTTGAWVRGGCPSL